MRTYHLTLQIYDADDVPEPKVADAVAAAVEHSTAREAIETAIAASLNAAPEISLAMTPWPMPSPWE